MLEVGDAAVYPGFVDVHNHHALAGRTDLFELSLPRRSTLDEILDRVRDKARPLPADAWIVGGAVPTTLLPTLANTASRLRLDEAAGGRPVVLVEDSPSQPLGEHARAGARRHHGRQHPLLRVTMLDPDDGTPTGVLLEAAGIPVQEACDRSGGLTAGAARGGIPSRRRAARTPSGSRPSRMRGSRSRSCRRWPTWIGDDELNAWVVSSLLSTTRSSASTRSASR